MSKGYPKQLVGFLGTFGLCFLVMGIFRAAELSFELFHLQKMISQERGFELAADPHAKVNSIVNFLGAMLLLILVSTAMVIAAFRMDRENRRIRNQTSKPAK